jgi:hypothetical protein
MRSIAPWLVILPLVLLLGHCSREFLAIDACLDAGKVYDYASGICRSDVQHLPYVPYIERWWHLLLGAAASIGVGIFALITRRENSGPRAF